MKGKIIIFVTLIFIGSCAVDATRNNIQKTGALNDDWEAIEKIESERWSREKIISVLGIPHEIIKNKKQMSDILFYNYPQSNHQQWGFEVSGNNSLLGITFIPTSFNRKDFTIGTVTQKWGASCAKKKEVDSSQHFVKNIYYLDCGKNHRAYLNKYGEVTSLAITWQN
jgi:hypothetical protein